VGAAGLGVPGRDVFPGQCPELGVQAGLVAFDGEQVVRAAAMHVSGVTRSGTAPGNPSPARSPFGASQAHSAIAV
jgi:hypothetical protein